MGFFERVKFDRLMIGLRDEGEGMKEREEREERGGG